MAVQQMTRTEAIAAAIMEELRRRRQMIDSDDGSLASITVTVKLQDAAEQVRAVIVEDQRIVARRRSDLRTFNE